MDSARRLYVYAISGISLLLLTIAGVNIASLLFEAVRWRTSDDALLAGATDGLRQQVSVYASIALVSLPVWGLHWWLAQRAVAVSPATTTEDDEHSSTLRALYRAIVLMASTIAVVTAAVDLLQRGLQELLISSSPSDTGSNVTNSLAVVLVVGMVGLYHARTMARPVATVPSGAAGWLGRVPTLLALSIGLGMVLSGTARLIAVIVERVLWSGDLLYNAQAWERGAADACAVALIGLVLWTPLWVNRTRLQRTPAAEASALNNAERRANLWQLWLVLATVVTLTIAAIMLQLSLYRTLDWLFLDSSSSEVPVGREAVSLLLRALPSLAIAGYLLWWTRSAACDGDEDDLGLQRAQWFGVAVPGLAMLGSGLVMVGMAVVDTTRDANVLNGDTDWPRRALVRAIAVVTVGLLVWAVGWMRALNLPGSAASRERRGYLLLVLGSALIVSLTASAVLLYTLLQRVLDATPNSGSSISTSLITLAVTLPILAAHGLLWRAMPDAPSRASTTAPDSSADAARTTSTATIMRPDLGVARSRSVRLELHLPADQNAADVVADLRRHLPDYARIDVVGEAVADDEVNGDSAADRGVPLQ